MARTFEQQLAALRALDAPNAIADLRKVLHGKRGLLIAVAAKLVEDHRLDTLVDDMVIAFEALIEDGPKVDPGCRGKLAIARALHTLDAWEERVFVRGLRVVQLEGPLREDTAAAVRGACGIAHVGRSANALDVLAALLADEHRNARIAAAQGLADAGRVEATALLRYKLLAGGETETEVLAACFDALFALARDASAEFAIELLAHGGDVAEAAALALGSARMASATTALAAWCDACRPEQRQRVGYVALALLRTDEANAILVTAMRERARADAKAAAKALATFEETLDPALRREIATIADG